MPPHSSPRGKLCPRVSLHLSVPLLFRAAASSASYLQSPLQPQAGSQQSATNTALTTLSSDSYAAKSRCYFLSPPPGHRSHPMGLVVSSQKRGAFQTPGSTPFLWGQLLCCPRRGKDEMSSVPLCQETPRAGGGWFCLFLTRAALGEPFMITSS